MNDLPVESTPIYFAEEVLGLGRLYDWQSEVVTWFEEAPIKTVRGTVCTPNESGKSSVVIPTLVLWWLAMHEMGKVVVTTRSGLQLETQILPAIHRFSSKFKGWTFNERKIKTPTGGEAVFFTTNEDNRAEGAHSIVNKMVGPVLIIIDEAKSVDESIFSAIDRCGYSGLLYTSSPGGMVGPFYDSHFRPELGFHRRRVGLLECPHIEQEKIDRIIEKYGPDHPFTRSTLHGEFMEASGELRFSRAGLDRLKEMADGYEKDWRKKVVEQPSMTPIGELHRQPDGRTIAWQPDAETGWLWTTEAAKPIPGCRYVGFCDPMTGEQSEGSLKRDTHAAGILRLGYTDETTSIPRQVNDEIVAVLHHPEGCRWDNDILAERFAMLLALYRCPAIVEANNSGTEVMRLLMNAGCTLWRRQKRDHRNPGKLLDVVGFQTNTATKNLWIGALGTAIREETLDCRYPMAASQFGTFILNEKGTGEAQGGCFDDFVTGVGLALHARNYATRFRLPEMPRIYAPLMQGNGQQGSQRQGALT